MAEYKSESIITLTPLEGIREKIAMYAGSNTNEAIIHCVKEVISNSLDEFLAGHGNKIIVDLDSQLNKISILDNGRGIPHDKVDAIATLNHTSGKFKSKVDSGYHVSLGTNGIGNKLLSALGSQTITSYQNGVAYSNSYTYQTIGKPIIQKIKHANGLKVEWIPDEGVVDDTTLHSDKIRQLLEDFSYVTPGLTFVFSHNGKTQVIKAKSLSDVFLEYYSEKFVFL
jgi:DNA gyrase/topoisomerase IV subunit B